MQFQIGPEFLPDYREAFTNTLTISSGQTKELVGEQDIDAILVEDGGTLVIPSELELWYINLTVAEGGKLITGTKESPNVSKAELIKKDAELDTDFDPFQWGQGIQCFGNWTTYGRQIPKTWSTIADAVKGATEIVLDTESIAWQVGDELIIPDTRQIGEYTFNTFSKIRYEATVTIQAIDGNRIMLSKPLDFEHLAVVNPRTGETVQKAVVANVTRNIVFRSENPDVISHRGHTAVIHTGTADVRYASFIGMGRTTGELINNTPLDRSKVGTNQIAKYAFHWHHAAHHSEADHGGGHLIGCFLDGLKGNKWGVVIHGSHDMHVEENVTRYFTGAGIVTEDGYERDYLIKRNFCFGSWGNLKSRANTFPESFSPGAEGSGIWNHSALGRTVENCCCNNFVGFQMMYRAQVRDRQNPTLNLLVPPIEFRDNIAITNHQGLETWICPNAVVENFISVNSGGAGVLMGQGDSGQITLNNPKLVNTKIDRPGEIVQMPLIGSGVHSSQAYTDLVQINGGIVSGFQYGIRDARIFNAINVDARGNTLDVFLQQKPAISYSLEGTKYDTIFPEDIEPPPEVWEPAEIGPPFLSDPNFRVRNGVIEKRK